MPIELKIPVVGESITEVQISEWLKAEGDTLEKDEPVAVVDSEKTTFELPAPETGRLTKILHKAGETVKVGEVVAQFEPAAKTDSKTAKSETKPEPSVSRKRVEKPGTPEKSPQPVTNGIPVPETNGRKDMAKAKNEEQGAQSIEPEPPVTAPQLASEVSIESTRLKPVSGAEDEIVPMTMLRRTVARRLVEAQQTMAMLTTFNEVDMDAVQKLRQQHREEFQKRYGVKLGLMSFFVKAVIDALKQFPQLNAEVRGNDIAYHNVFDIGIAVASERGLAVPVLRRAERLSFAEVEKSIAELAERARAGRLEPHDLEGGTFTITNGGIFGSLLSTPIINPPQTGILGMHTIEDRPVAREGLVVIRPMMYVALTYDHRIVDGREAVLFLRRIREAIESPVRLLLEV